MAQNWAEITREIINYGRFINKFPPNIITSISQLERINKKKNEDKKCSIKYYQYIYIYIYICTESTSYPEKRLELNL